MTAENATIYVRTPTDEELQELKRMTRQEIFVDLRKPLGPTLKDMRPAM